MEQTLSNNEKIAEALRLLEDAAKGKKEELRVLVSNKYHNLKDALGEAELGMAEAMAAAKKRTMAAALQAKDLGLVKAKEIAADVDEQVRENPWPYIGGVAVAALLAGYILGRNK
ncbi:MAG: DUF883 C-terminal domain-containing protein [Kiritimatiellia bacterium]